MSSLVLQGFNKQLVELLDDIENVLPGDVDIKTVKNSLLLLKKTNPRKIIEVWKLYICDKYYQEIENNEMDFFINKDYNDDIALDNKSDAIKMIERLREPIKKMKEDDKVVVMKYILNLSKLSILYYKK